MKVNQQLSSHLELVPLPNKRHPKSDKIGQCMDIKYGDFDVIYPIQTVILLM